MVFERNSSSVMIVSSVSKTTEFFSAILPQSNFSPIISVSSAGEARRTLTSFPVDIVVINAPLCDEFGTELAIELAEKNESGILMLVKAELYDSVTDKLEDSGILTVAKPAGRQVVFQSLKLLVATTAKFHSIGQKNSSAASLAEKMEEIRLINRAKFLLIEKLRMSESEAHRYIEKSAMDLCVKRRQVAENIIRTYEN